MATETETPVRTDAETSSWRSATIAALIGGAAMGLMIQFVMGIMPVIGALYGFQSLAAGWVAHLFHSVVFGLLYAAIATRPSLSAYASRLGSGAVVGAAYGVVVWVVAAGFVMPIWLSAIGLPGPGVPNFDPQSLVGHVVFGVILGTAYAVLLNR
jgi:uncharacterized membrane protein YagU involved in acid resistance